MSIKLPSSYSLRNLLITFIISGRLLKIVALLGIIVSINVVDTNTLVGNKGLITYKVDIISKVITEVVTTLLDIYLI